MNNLVILYFSLGFSAVVWLVLVLLYGSHVFYNQPIHYQDLIGNSPYILSYNYYGASLEDLTLDKLIIL